MDVIKSFEQDTITYLKKNGIAMRNKHVLVALSGGADSVALLSVLVSLMSLLGHKVSALHVNHGIRGTEADNDEAYCIKLCALLGAEIKVYHADIPALALQNKQSLELCGREYRYRVLKQYCEDNGIDYIATAHNANDNAETVLYNLLRGSGLDGLKGIPMRRANIIRPILCMERTRIEEYLSALGRNYVTDCTNKDNTYTRNYIRNVLLPACAHINSDAVSAINRAASAVAEDVEYMDILAEKAMDERCDLVSLPPALQSRIIKSLYEKRYKYTLESAHIFALQRALKSDGCKHISLPGGVTAKVVGGAVYFDDSFPPLEKTFIDFGTTCLCGGSVKITLSEEWEGKELSRLNADAITGDLYVRSRAVGDKLTVRGINRSVKKCFIDKKIPAPIRENIPILCDSKGIIYVPYIGVSDRVHPRMGDRIIGVSVVFDERFGLKE